MADIESKPKVNDAAEVSASGPASSELIEAPIGYNRQVSVSEAAESSGQGLNAPFWLRWIELPFHVADPNTGKKLPEAAGWAMDSVGRAPLNQVGSYVGSAILRLATVEAGCKNPLTCTNKVHGFKPSSLLTVMTSIVGVVSALLMPIVGSMVDHTAHRRMVGIVSGFLSVALIGAQIWISQENWFGMLVIDTIQTFVYLIHTTSVFAYLPDLSLEQDVISHYTSNFNFRQYIGQFVFVSLLIIDGQARQLDRSVASSVQTASDAAGMGFGFGALFIGYAWTFLFRERPPLSQVPEGSSVLTAGFKQLGTTSKKVWKDYRHLRWFMVSLLFSPEAGAGVILSIAVTFLTVFMKFTGIDIAKASLCLIAGNLPGSLFSKVMCKWMNPLNSYRVSMFLLGLSLSVSAAMFKGPENRDAVLGMAVVWGFCMGWAYPSQRVLFCTLIPKGQETEFMGLFVFTGQILGWLPSLVFTIMNEQNVNMKWGLGMVGFFCAAAVICTFPMGSYENAVRTVQQDSEEKLKQIVAATAHAAPPSIKIVGVTVETDDVVASNSSAEPVDSIDDEHAGAPVDTTPTDEKV